MMAAMAATMAMSAITKGLRGEFRSASAPAALSSAAAMVTVPSLRTNSRVGTAARDAFLAAHVQRVCAVAGSAPSQVSTMTVETSRTAVIDPPSTSARTPVVRGRTVVRRRRLARRAVSLERQLSHMRSASRMRFGGVDERSGSGESVEEVEEAIAAAVTEAAVKEQLERQFAHSVSTSHQSPRSNNSPSSLYSNTQLLTAEEEVALSQKIQRRRVLEETKQQLVEQLGREPLLEEWAMFLQMKPTDLKLQLDEAKAARDELVQRNVRLVASVARKYVTASPHFTYDDLCQEGTIGLMRAAELYDGKRGFRFSTFAHWWIRRGIQRALSDTGRTIRLPVWMNEFVDKVRSARIAVTQQLAREPTVDEIAQHLGVTRERVQFVYKVARQPTSLDSVVYHNDSSQILLIDTISDEDESADDLNDADIDFLKMDLEDLLDTLKPREGAVLRMRYGLDDGRSKSWDEIASKLEFTPQTIRRDEKSGLKKLRHPQRASYLKTYLV
eukprot:jgi/Chlat1/1617/Chrsp127S01942